MNAVALYRLEQEFTRYGLAISRQNMANWCIRLGEEYLAILYIQYILEEIPKHMDDKDSSFLKNLLPWSENLPTEIRKI